ncbi:MAG: Hsp20/alpha crystallin family protein [Nitrososphaerota archaeon]
MWKIWAINTITVEAPGIPKDKITVKAGTIISTFLESKKGRRGEKRKNYFKNERSYSSLRRRISLPEEIIPSKIDAIMEMEFL